MKLAEFFYNLPKELIAQHPLKNRGDAKLLVINRKTHQLSHHKFQEIARFFKSGDVLVLNNTRVFKARLKGKKETGGNVELLIVRQNNDELWEVLMHSSKRIKIGSKIFFEDGVSATIKKKAPGKCFLEFSMPVKEIIKNFGIVPLPHYIKRDALLNDEEYYQTIFAKKEGSVAAPTAGLHFTSPLLKEIENRGTKIIEITLHIGPGTFKPIRTKDIEEHKMEPEFIEVSEEAAQVINNGKRIIGVGTSVSRSLESVIHKNVGQGFPEPGQVSLANNIANSFMKSDAAVDFSLRKISAFSGFTDLFVYPGYKFRIIDSLITNFHLPCSTPLLLVCAFAGKDLIFRTYKEAIAQNYRFLSYGDAMLII